MNIQIKNKIRNLFNGVSSFFHDLTETVLSVFRIFILSSLRIYVLSRKYTKHRNSKNVVVLANGPSLRNVLEKGKIDLEDTDVFCVNGFCRSEYFWKIKPRFYFLVDGAFFSPEDDRTRKIVSGVISLLNKVDWPMFLVVPSFISRKTINGMICNRNINPLWQNCTSVDGFKCFRHWIYRNRLGMPSCINVANFAFMTAIWMGYKQIKVYGLDHSWVKTYAVDDDNTFCVKEAHVYKDDNDGFVRHPETTLFKELSDFVTALRIHFIINEYANSVGVKIYNCTKGSYVEAYDRLID